MPTISIIMSVYNEKKEWVAESILSIINQTYKDFEFIIVIDNPSIDQTVYDYLVEISKVDNRITLVFNNANLGLAMCLNKAIMISSGIYIARMDADDISMPERLFEELEFLIENDADMVSSNAYIIDEQSNVVKELPAKSFDPTRELEYSNTIIHPTVLIKKSVIEDVGLYRNFKRSQDYDLWLRLLTSGYCIRTTNRHLLKYRVRKTSITNSGRLEQYYINLYQRKLFFERRKKGTDKFSEENLNNYILSKRITDKKNNRCIECVKHLDLSKELLRNKKISFVKQFARAWFIYPSIASRAFIHMIRKGKV